MTLPERILKHLREHGPQNTTHLSETLGARYAAVSGAISALRRRELVDLSHEVPTGGHPLVYYHAVGYECYPSDTSTWSTDLGPDRVLERMAHEVAMLRDEYPDVEIAALVYSNGPIPGV